ncbi:hypothetical protein FE257_012764 [Aspergillus nanangensis]|uniref:Proline dehydrogenase n=1 Tax=Aspergillus nanangensis TaxID=2582783 RepID=A0AAD4CGV8_ASPNN|nr:hypothetical protein FE257_012764 [Aspergillus nanangensis]
MQPQRIWPRRPGHLAYIVGSLPLRHASTSSSTHPATLLAAAPAPSSPRHAPLAVMPTRTLVKSLVFTSIMASPLLQPCLSVMKYVVESKSMLLSPARNPLMNHLLRATIYNHFCAGVNENEVRSTVKYMKGLGFKGVILGYGRESVAKVDPDDLDGQVPQANQQQVVEERAIEEWKQGNLRTLKMIDEGDYLGIKFTGAGPAAVEALRRGDPSPPPLIQQAINEICQATAAQKSRLWIDAEQQVFQPAIDAWTIDLMRQFNRAGNVVVYNTIQAYLKASTANVQRHLTLAANEGWSLGIKLVRGAYIAHDIRSRIHDTKPDTDRNYDHIVQSLLTREFPLRGGSSFPDVRLFVASHNAETVRKAYALSRHRRDNHLPTIPVEMGQLQGMADESLVVLGSPGHNSLDGLNVRLADRMRRRDMVFA